MKNFLNDLSMLAIGGVAMIIATWLSTPIDMKLIHNNNTILIFFLIAIAWCGLAKLFRKE